MVATAMPISSQLSGNIILGANFFPPKIIFASKDKGIATISQQEEGDTIISFILFNVHRGVYIMIYIYICFFNNNTPIVLLMHL